MTHVLRVMEYICWNVGVRSDVMLPRVDEGHYYCITEGVYSVAILFLGLEQEDPSLVIPWSTCSRAHDFRRHWWPIRPILHR